MQYKNNTLYYIYDPMCSWCYAFEQSLQVLKQQLPSGLEFQAILGGRPADSNTPMPINTQLMIQQAWRQIENTVPHIQFNFDFWTNNTAFRSTYPACRAVLAAENQSPLLADPMRKAIQHAYYQEAKNPSLIDHLINCAEQLKLDINQFHHDLLSPAISDKLTEHIQFSRLLGVSSYPSLRLILLDEIYTISIDYKAITPTVTQINKLLEAHSDNGVESPCIRNCCLDNDDICLGCFRQLDEITNWSYCSNSEKQAILDDAAQRKIKYNKNLI